MIRNSYGMQNGTDLLYHHYEFGGDRICAMHTPERIAVGIAR